MLEVRPGLGGVVIEFELSVGYMLAQVRSSKYEIVTEPVTCMVSM